MPPEIPEKRINLVSRCDKLSAEFCSRKPFNFRRGINERLMGSWRHFRWSCVWFLIIHLWIFCRLTFAIPEINNQMINVMRLWSEKLEVPAVIYRGISVEHWSLCWYFQMFVYQPDDWELLFCVFKASETALPLQTWCILNWQRKHSTSQAIKEPSALSQAHRQYLYYSTI